MYIYKYNICIIIQLYFNLCNSLFIYKFAFLFIKLFIIIANDFFYLHIVPKSMAMPQPFTRQKFMAIKSDSIFIKSKKNG